MLTNVSEEELSKPPPSASLWQRMSVFDARALLGYYCYRAGSLDAAERIWSRLPKSNQQVRPEIEALVDEVRMEQAMQRELEQVEQEENDLVQAGVSGVRSRPLAAGDPNSSSSQWRIQAPTGPQPTRLEPTDPQTAPPPQTTHSTGAPLERRLMGSGHQPHGWGPGGCNPRGDSRGTSRQHLVGQ